MFVRACVLCAIDCSMALLCIADWISTTVWLYGCVWPHKFPNGCTTIFVECGAVCVRACVCMFASSCTDIVYPRRWRRLSVMRARATGVQSHCTLIRDVRDIRVQTVLLKYRNKNHYSQLSAAMLSVMYDHLFHHMRQPSITHLLVAIQAPAVD